MSDIATLTASRSTARKDLVRDELLGRPGADRDFVVVGATPELLIASGYRPVGHDFPVFLHPETHEEYALARTERKHGRGYRGFEFFASPDVTLEDDLARRDLTINAMARGDDGVLVDPFGGAVDLAAGTTVAVGPLGVLLSGSDGDRGWLVTGTVTQEVLDQAAADLLAGTVSRDNTVFGGAR